MCCRRSRHGGLNSGVLSSHKPLPHTAHSSARRTAVVSVPEGGNYHTQQLQAQRCPSRTHPYAWQAHVTPLRHVVCPGCIAAEFTAPHRGNTQGGRHE